MCKQYKESFADIAQLDHEIRASHSVGSCPGQPVFIPHPLPGQILEELRAFTSKFSPALFQAGYTAMRKSEFGFLWEHLALMVILERLPRVEAEERPWSRFCVKDARATPMFVFFDMWSPEEARSFSEQKVLQERLHREVRNTGTITVIVSARVGTAISGSKRLRRPWRDSAAGPRLPYLSAEADKFLPYLYPPSFAVSLVPCIPYSLTESLTPLQRGSPRRYQGLGIQRFSLALHCFSVLYQDLGHKL